MTGYTIAAASGSAMAEAILIECPFCDETRCKDSLTPKGVRNALAAYMAHLVESHWDMLELGR
jgi:hypothetical protein